MKASPARYERGFTSPVRSAERGFTLVELMVALFIFALIAAAGVSLLGFSIGAQASAGKRLDEAAALRRIGALLSADLAQATHRITRDSDGAPWAAFLGGTGARDAPALVFVRRGWSNERGEPRASLQKVEYRLVDDRIERRAWPMLDGAQPGPPAALLSGVRSMTLRYRTGGEWRDRWDPTRADALPRAVEAVIDIEGVGPVRQLFLAGTGD